MNETPLTTGQNQLGSFAMLTGSLSVEARKAFEEATVERSYKTGERLFSQDAEPDGIFFLRSGRVKLGATSLNGKKMLLHIAAPGQVLGLGTIGGRPYEVTAECLGNCHVSFVPRWRLLEILRRHPDAGITVALALSEDLDCAYESVRLLRSKGKRTSLTSCS